ncbi:uncharacterized protein JN550_006768 [Neoarthrinium moseri]|uniref:uncharacterized protein n=1 Tax=Neoarthrinium moseri TaxID=1658444 RepID=UPI001FDC7924|nr:uncharacterized protein JN550_006768 [Neoarthrinium moseri]KAI1867961.1 hypothetical protein JN550_006768 [Neoarthrinium moseri]
MAESSPARKSAQISSPERRHIGSYLSDDRNNELSHQQALAAAAVEHERVRLAALKTIETHALRLEQLRLRDEESRILERQRIERERLEQERKLRDEEKRLRDLEAQKVEKLPPVEPKPKPKPEASDVPAPTTGNGPDGTHTEVSGPGASAKPAALVPPKASLFGTSSASPATETQGQANGTAAKSASPFQQTPSATQQAPAPSNPFLKATTPAAAPATNPFAKPTKAAANPFQKATPTPAANGLPTNATVPAAAPSQIQRTQAVDRYIQIHQSLKKIRASIKEQMKTNIDLKKNAGDMRREIRKSIGQLTGERGANKQQLERIRNTLTAALRGQPPSALVDPSEFVCDKREPAQDASINGEVPSLFIYLLNILAKDMIKQFDSECGATPSKADPIGVVAAQIFSTKDFLWRGKSLIDILMAKFRVACPVLFGYRGSEKTEQGRARLGWRREEGHWATEQQHVDRMKGLGVGYASIALRDFSKAKTTNPFPPSHYWTSMARILNTPPAEISDTQCTVLRAMINLYEEKFINFYGNQAIAALRKALVEFPAKAPAKTPAVSALEILAQLYIKNFGLDLR